MTVPPEMVMLPLLSMPSLPLLVPLTLPPFRYMWLAELMASSEELKATTVPSVRVKVPLVSMASWPDDEAFTVPPLMVMAPVLLMAFGEAVTLLLYLYWLPVVVAVMLPPPMASVPSDLMHLPPVPVARSVSVPSVILILLSAFRQLAPLASFSVPS